MNSLKFTTFYPINTNYSFTIPINPNTQSLTYPIPSSPNSSIAKSYLQQVIHQHTSQKSVQMKNQQDYSPYYQQYYPLEQNYFADELFEITERYIPTSYGQIYSMTAGTPGQPLIIIVHGSGPKNSSAQYAPILQEYLVRISYIEKFYIVAIDCPGYGKSIGSKEAVKTFPLQMFQEILKALNYKNYFAMYGHSQGGAAIFNSVFQKPSLTEIMLMDRPVCGNIQRFRKFNTPTLLIYDIEDDGHPIWQGKLLYKELAFSELYTYRGSRDPYWVPDNIWEKMMNFFSKYANNRKGRANIFTNQRAVSLTPSVKDKSVEKNAKKLLPKKKQETQEKENKKVQVQKQAKRNSSKESSQLSKSKGHKSRSLDLRRTETIFLKKDKKIGSRVRINQLQKVEQLEHEKDELLSVYSSSLSEEEKNELKMMEEEMKEKQAELLKDEKRFKKPQSNSYQINEKVVIGDAQQQELLSKDNTQIKPECKAQQNIQNPQTEKKEPKKLSQQEQNYKCAICFDVYYRPLQTNCKHIFCTKCLLEAMLVNQRCPLCRANITKKTEKKELHEEVLKLMKKEDIQKREKAYLKLKLMLDSIVMIEIGNRSIELETKKSHFSKTKKKYMWELFAKEKANFKFQEVSFNINMGEPNSKPVKVRNAPFVFESRGTFSFSCEITIKPRNQEYAPVTSVYRINIEPGTHTQVIAFKKKIYLKE